jgi:two-component system, NarL family, nitrate/nitrite response regulator NarL
MAQCFPLLNSEVQPIRVLLVGNERVMRAALRALIDGQPGTKVIGEVDDLEAALAAIMSGQPDVTLLDPDHCGGADVLADVMRAAMNRTRILLLTGSPDSTPVSEALGNGAAGLVLKQQAPEVLIKAIRKVHEGELWLDRSVAARLLTELSRADHEKRSDPDTAKAASLTKRERQVVTLVSQGLRNTQVAECLAISEITVRNHLTSIFRKLEVANRFQLVIHAFRCGLAALPSRMEPATEPTQGDTVQQEKTS